MKLAMSLVSSCQLMADIPASKQKQNLIKAFSCKGVGFLFAVLIIEREKIKEYNLNNMEKLVWGESK